MQYDMVNCSFCMKGYNQESRLPRTLSQCNHTICEECLSTLLKNPQPKCLVDNTELDPNLKEAQEFPINSLAKQLLEDNPEWEICETHKNKIELVCLTDKCKLCVNCALENGHKDHSIKHLMEIKMKLDSKVKGLGSALEHLDEYQKNIYDTLEEKRHSMLKIVNTKFEELAFLLKMKKLGLSSEINSYFNKEKNRLVYGLGVESPARACMSNKLSNYKDLLNKKEVFGLLEEDISQFVSKLDNIFLQKQVQELNQKLTALSTAFGECLTTQIDLIAQLGMDGTSFTEKLNTLYPQESGEDISNKLISPITATKVETSLEFDTYGGDLLVSATNRNPKIMRLNISEWNEMKEAKIKLDGFLFREEDLKILTDVWAELEKIKTIRIDGGFQKDVPNDKLANLFEAIFVKPEMLETIEIDFEESEVRDESLLFLANKVLPQATNLKFLSLSLPQTNLTDKFVQALAQSALPSLKALESLSLYLGNTGVSEEALIEMFVSMPTLKKFELGMSYTEITDKGLQIFIKNMLSSMELLEHFKMRLWKTKVTDEGVIDLFTNLPDVKNFILDLGSTKITDASIQFFINTKFPTLKKLKNFEIHLFDTEVTEKTTAQLFDIKNNLLN